MNGNAANKSYRSYGTYLAAPAIVLLAASATLSPRAAVAHDRTTSFSTWSIHGRRAEVTVRLSELDVSRFPWGSRGVGELDRELGAYLVQHLELLAADLACPATGPSRRLESPPGRLTYEWRVECPTEGVLRLRSRMLAEVAPSHLHFARVSLDDGEPREHMFSEGERPWLLDAGGDAASPSGPAPETSLGEFVVLGIRHILSGWDHLAFLLALLLIGGKLGEIAKVVTGFTVAHSITLGLAALGYVRPDSPPVEALIGLSIALVAVENVWLLGRRDRGLPLAVAGGLFFLSAGAAAGYGRVPALTLGGLAIFTLFYFEILRRLAGGGSVRWAVAFLFGLVHGFGFASVLGEAGLAAGRVARALFGFNAGVEIGQLAVVALTWPALRAAMRRRNGGLRVVVVEAGSATVLALGVFWFVSRAFG